MKKGLVLVLVVLIVMALGATASHADYGMILQVVQTDTTEMNGLVTAISWYPYQAPWSINHNINSDIQIALDGGLAEERQPVPQSFFGEIWWDTTPNTFNLYYGYIIASSIGGPWIVPDAPAQIFLRRQGEQDLVYSPKTWGVYTAAGLTGSYEFEIRYAPVPEPSGLLALGSELLGLAFAIRRRL